MIKFLLSGAIGYGFYYFISNYLTTHYSNQLDKNTLLMVSGTLALIGLLIVYGILNEISLMLKQKTNFLFLSFALSAASFIIYTLCAKLGIAMPSLPPGLF